MYSTRKLTEKIWNPFEIRFWTENSWFSTLDLQIKFSRSREVSWILWVLVGSVDVDKYVWHVKLWTTDVVRNWRTRQLVWKLDFLTTFEIVFRSQLLPISWRRNNDNHNYGSSQEHSEKVDLSQKGRILIFRFNLWLEFNLPYNFLVSGVGEGKGWGGGEQGGKCPEPVSLYSLRKSL